MAIRDKFEEAEKNGMKVVTNMNGEKRANDKLNMMMAKLNKVEQRAYDTLKRGEELDMLSDEQKEQLKKLEEKRKQ